MTVMTEDQIREFVDDATSTPGDRATATEMITARWLRDQAAAAEEARDAIYEEARDSWDGT
jgi:hypothetical protein